MNILIDENIPYATEFFSNIGSITRFSGRELVSEQLVETDILLVRSITKVNDALLKQAKNLKFVGTATIGEDHIDKQLLAERGIAFSSAPGCNAISVAEYVISSLYVLAEKYQFDLFTKKVAIIGVGNIGKALQTKLAVLGLELLLVDPIRQKNENASGFVSLEYALSNADVVTFHTPLTYEGEHKTHHLLNEQTVKLLKEDVCLINACRGEVFDNRALLSQIKKRAAQHIQPIKLVLDVWENEPSPLAELIPFTDIATAHIAGYSLEGKARGTEILYHKVCELMKQSVKVKLPALLPIATHSNLTLQKNSHDENALKSLIHLVYDVRRDDALFRHYLTSKGFDWLRKNYPIRREWSSLALDIKKNDQKGVNFLQLGFAI